MRRSKVETISHLVLQNDEWTALHPPKRPPVRRAMLVQKAEGRLTAALKHREPVARLKSEAERVRQAQLGYWRSCQTIAVPLVGVEDKAIERQLTNVSEIIELWQSLTIHEIIAKYAPPHG